MDFVRLFAFCCLLFNSIRCQDSNREILQKLLDKYDKDTSPHGDNATVVKVGFYMQSLDVGDQEFDMGFYFRNTWYDPRLAFSPTGGRTEMMIKVPEDLQDKVWIPDLYFRNAKEVKRPTLPTHQCLMKLNNNGKIWNACRYQAKFKCHMMFHRHPLDTQKCAIIVESFGHTMKTLVLKFLSQSDEGLSALGLDDNSEIPSYAFVESQLLDCSMNYSTGAYPCLNMRLVLKRDSISQHRPAAQSLLLVVLYVSFFLGMKNPNIRFSFILFIGLTIWLTGITLELTNLRPKSASGYITAGDICLPMTGFLYVLVLLHFLLVYRLSTKGESEGKEGPHKGKAKTVDKVGMIGYPILVILWFIIYYSLWS